jgi:two-component system response regulator YesN
MNRKHTYSVLVAEDEALIRENIVKKLREGCPDFEVVGQAADGREALEAIAELYPDVLITDIRMPVIDGLALVREVYYTFPDIKVLIVSGYDQFSYAREALVLGVKDYLVKPVGASELRAAMSRLLVQLEAAQARFESEHPAFPESASQEELVSMVQEYLRSHFSEEVSLAELAARFHVNPPYLTRLFKRLVGSAPVRYLRDLRINHARKLLEERPELEIKEIGVIAGYPDQGYFSRVFRQAIGVSPQEYRDGRAGQAPPDNADGNA